MWVGAVVHGARLILYMYLIHVFNRYSFLLGLRGMRGLTLLCVER